MDIKVNAASQALKPEGVQQTRQAEGNFKFILASHIEDAALKEHLTALIGAISEQGKKIGKKKDVRDMKKYRGLIKEFLNEIVNRSHTFERENFLDRKGRHRVYGIIRLIDQNLDELAKELVKEEQDNIAILAKIGEIEGLILDIFT